MARYWVGGNGTWDGTVGTKWSTAPGGAGGASVPNSAQDVILDATAGTVTITVSGTAQARSIVAAGFTGTFGGTGNIQITGSNTGLQNSGKSLEWGPPGVMTLNYTGRYTITGSTGSGSINFNGHTLNLTNIISFNNAPSTWTLLNPIVTTNNVEFNNGTLNTNNYNITCNRFDVGNGVTAKTLNLGSSIIECTQTSGAAFVNQLPTAATLNGTYTIRLTGIVTSTTNFIGGTLAAGGGTYYNVEFIRGSGTGAVIIEGSNTFLNFTDTGTAAHDITFQAGSTHTFENFNVVGVSEFARTRLLSSTTSPSITTVNLVKTGEGFVYCDYLDLGANMTSVTPADTTWYAGYNSIGTGNGWVFRNPLGLLLMGVGG